ncbi:MAG: hypothetical protein IJT20_03300, partial [Synergistaceae bacterium]|nr:hypothetical protein [Synergistaceae bacterium]
TFNGEIKRYLPDFLVRLDNGITLILETKGQRTEQARIKEQALKDWIKAVNGAKEWGVWRCAVSRNPGDVDGIIKNMYE